MKGKSAVLVLAASALLLTFTGCATIPMAPPEMDAAAKQFTVPPDLSRIYVFRSESFGFAVRMQVMVDGKFIGTTKGHVFLYADVPPGKHTITSVAENTDTLDVVTTAGQATFVWQEVKMGFLYARNRLQEVDPASGRKGVLMCSLGALAP